MPPRINPNSLEPQARTLVLTSPTAGQRLTSDYYVEGYAARYAPYPLYEDEEGPVYERFEPGAFQSCDMSDIIMQYDHAGSVFARTTNQSLIVEATDQGLFIAADLGRTQAARQMYEEIRAGMVTKMSWRFALGDYEYLPLERTIVHRSVKRIYDVSAVSIPANSNTVINARAWAERVIDLPQEPGAALEEARRKLRLKIQIGGM